MVLGMASLILIACKSLTLPPYAATRTKPSNMPNLILDYHGRLNSPLIVNLGTIQINLGFDYVLR